MGTYDIPATFEYITHVNGHHKIAFIGHSMGTTQMLYALAKMPNFFADRLSIFVALSPIAAISNLGVTLLKFLVVFQDDLFLLLTIFKVVRLLPYI